MRDCLVLCTLKEIDCFTVTFLTLVYTKKFGIYKKGDILASFEQFEDETPINGKQIQGFWTKKMPHEI